MLDAVLRRWWVIALLATVSGVGAYALASRQPKQYTASSALLFLNRSLAQELLGKQIIDNVDPSRAAATNQSLVQLPSVARLVAAQLKVPTSRVVGDVSFGSDAQSDVLPVTVTDTSPRLAAAIANAYVNQYINFRKTATENQLTTAESLINRKLAAIPVSARNGPVATALLGDRNQLDLLKSAQTGDAQVVETASTPRSPSAPNPSKDAVLGVLLGLLVGTALVVFLEQRDRRLKTTEQVEAVYGVSMIGAVPESPALRRGLTGLHPEQEAFLMLRAQLRYFDVNRQIHTVLVTSAESGEGKSLVSLNLALAAARTDERRTLLIEADLRRPSLAEAIDREPGAGLAELLSRSHDLESGLRELVIAADDTEEGERPPNLDILLAGSTPPNPVELLESERMTALLSKAAALYDVVVIDTAPIGIISDAIPLVHQVDGVLVISRLNYSRRDNALRLMRRLNGLNAHILGVVINSFQARGGSPYGYYGYYGYPADTAEDQRDGSRRGRGREGSVTSR